MDEQGEGQWARTVTSTITIDGKKRVITLPLGAEPDLPEDEIKARAVEAWHELEAAERSLNAEEVARVQAVLTNNEVFDGLAFFDRLARDASEAVSGNVRLTLDGEPEPDDPPDREAWEAAATQRFHNICTTVLREYAADDAFRSTFARHVLRQAVAWTTAELKASMPRDQLLAMDDEAFHQAFMTRYHQEDFLTSAVALLGAAYFEQAVREIIEALEQDPDLGKKLTDAVRRDVAAKATPEIFHDGYAMIPAQQAVLALLNAIHNANTRKGWCDFNGGRVPTHTTKTNRKSKEPGAVYVSLRGYDGKAEPTDDALDTLWAQVGGLDDLTSDVLLVCLAACAKNSGDAWINVEAVLDARGIKRKQYQREPGNWQHGHRTEDRLAVGRSLAQLDCLWLEIQNVEVIRGGKRRKAQRLTHESRVVALLDKITQHDIEGGDIVLAARVVLGSWAKAYHELELVQRGLLAQKALAYDPHKRQPEKRLAKYLAFHYRYNAGIAAFNRSVKDLLEVAGIEPDAGRPQRTRDRLDQALSRLQEDRVLGRWSPIIESDVRPARGWFPQWLETKIALEAPAPVGAHYARIRR